MGDETRVASDSFIIRVNGAEVRVTNHTSVAAAMMMVGQPCRISVCGEPRAPLCGMGVCMECRATLNGQEHQRTCQTMCVAGMEIVTE